MNRQSATGRLARMAVLFGTLVLLLAGCTLGGSTGSSSATATLGGSVANNQPRPRPANMASDQTLKISLTIPSGLGELDPAFAQDVTPKQITSLLFDGLVTLDPLQRVEPWGARSWIISHDGLTYTFKLRSNQHFSDGTLVKPSDYARSLNRTITMCGQPHALANDLDAIKDATTMMAACDPSQPQSGKLTTLVGDSILPDDSANTLTIKLAQPASYFLSALTTPASFVTEASMPNPPQAPSDVTKYLLDYLSAGASGQGGSGMFYVARWTPDPSHSTDGLILKPNPHWWGQQAGKTPYFNEIDLTLIDNSHFPQGKLIHIDPTSAYASTLSPYYWDHGWYDEKALIQPLSNLPTFSDLHQQPVAAVASLSFDWASAPFDDINARKAFCLAAANYLNSLEVNDVVIDHSLSIVPRGVPGFNPNISPVLYDDFYGTLASQYWRQYLQDHGGKAPSVSFNAVSSVEFDFLRHIWSGWLGATVQPYGGSAAGSPPNVSLTTWVADYPDQQDILSRQLSAIAVNSPNASVPDALATSLLRQADSLPDWSNRTALYQRAEQYLINDAIICPMYQLTNKYAVQPWVKGGFDTDIRGLVPNDDWVNGYIAKH